MMGSTGTWRPQRRLGRFGILLALGAMITAVMFGTAGTAQAAEHVVYLEDGANPASVARSAGAQVDFEFTQVAQGFTADLSDAQVRKLNNDDRVVDVRVDKPFALTPFKRYPFKRYPFKRYPFKRFPFKRFDTSSPWFRQHTPTAIDRIGATDWADRVNADIAILDGGIDRSHPDLNVAAAVSCVRGEGPQDRDGHGTMVAGLAAASNNRNGIVGAAPGARIWSVKVADDEGTIMESSALCGLEYVLARSKSIEVVNLSWGGEGIAADEGCTSLVPPSPHRTRDWRRLPSAQRGSWPWRRAVQRGQGNAWGRSAEKGRKATSKSRRPGNASQQPVEEPTTDVLHGLICQITAANVTVVAAAGNEQADAGGFLPAAWPEVIAVSSLADTDGRAGGLGEPGCITEDPDDTLSSFSNYGSVVDIAAPGECVVTTDIDRGYAIGSGTSFAAPLVSGVAAVHAAENPRASVADIRAKIMATAEPGPIAGDTDGSWEGVLRATR